MLVLALDTTTRQGSAALVRDGGVLATYAGDAAIAHGARLPGDLIRLLDAHSLRIADVDLFAVASGPGSFTGLRIGIATMQGLALANGKPLAGISALDAIHDAVHSLRPQPSALSPRDEVGVWMEAGRGQVFSAKYKGTSVVETALVDMPAEILARWAREGTNPKMFAGDGALACRHLIHAAVPDAHIVDPLPPLAPSIARLAETEVQQRGPSSPDGIRPVYIRRPDVELARDRQADLRKADQSAVATVITMNWTIERTLSDRDLDDIVAIEQASFSNPWTREMYLRELQNPDVSFLYVLRVPGEGVVAFCSFWLVLDEAHINNIAVRGDFRGRGVGMALLEHVIQAGAARGADRATLEVRRSNAPARRLYERLGFAVAATRPNYYVSPPEDALILWRGSLKTTR